MDKKCPTRDLAVVILLSTSSSWCMSVCMVGDGSTDLHIPREGNHFQTEISFKQYISTFLWHSLSKGLKINPLQTDIRQELYFVEKLKKGTQRGSLMGFLEMAIKSLY